MCFLEHSNVSLAPGQKLSKVRGVWGGWNQQHLQFGYCILNFVEVECTV